MNWELYKNFKAEEFACQHCGKEGISEHLVSNLQNLRTYLDFSFVVSSGYRCPDHPIEAAKTEPGMHATGLAVDILCRGTEAYKIVTNACDYGFTGIGVSQNGNNRFIHLDIATQADGKFRPTVWSY
jgi:uncharacterized protein YcbK (DUF882 family)|tara:strand:- start:151 stop:531 length:381 start_codon:yes stop_codon:yes gene_type:complete